LSCLRVLFVRLSFEFQFEEQVFWNQSILQDRQGGAGARTVEREVRHVREASQSLYLSREVGFLEILQGDVNQGALLVTEHLLEECLAMSEYRGQ
jgi:hypothetical protein